MRQTKIFEFIPIVVYGDDDVGIVAPPTPPAPPPPPPPTPQGQENGPGPEFLPFDPELEWLREPPAFVFPEQEPHNQAPVTVLG